MISFLEILSFAFFMWFRVYHPPPVFSHHKPFPVCNTHRMVPYSLCSHKSRSQMKRQQRNTEAVPSEHCLDLPRPGWWLLFLLIKCFCKDFVVLDSIPSAFRMCYWAQIWNASNLTTGHIRLSTLEFGKICRLHHVLMHLSTVKLSTWHIFLWQLTSSSATQLKHNLRLPFKFASVRSENGVDSMLRRYKHWSNKR